MNIAEANAVDALLRFAAGEHLPRNPDEIDQLVAHARFLAGRIHRPLMAGPVGADLERDLRCRIGELLLEDDDDYPEDSIRPVDDVPVAGGRL